MLSESAQSEGSRDTHTGSTYAASARFQSFKDPVIIVFKFRVTVIVCIISKASIASYTNFAIDHLWGRQPTQNARQGYSQATLISKLHAVLTVLAIQLSREAHYGRNGILTVLQRMVSEGCG
jgi:hypothetical protein